MCLAPWIPSLLAAWLQGSLAVRLLPGSLAPRRLGPTVPQEDPADPGSGGRKRTGLQPQAVWEGRGGGDGVRDQQDFPETFSPYIKSKDLEI